MDGHVKQLRIGLSRALLNSEPNPGGMLPEEQRIDQVIDSVKAFDVGDISSATLRRVLSDNVVPGFSPMLWLADMVEQGVYDETVLTDNDEDD